MKRRFSTYFSLLAVFAASFVSGCLSYGPPNSSIDMQAWRQLHIAPDQRWEGPVTASYTYVLMGAVGDGSADADTPRGKAVRALERLLDDGVQTGMDSDSASKQPARVRLQANQYCIPAVPQANSPAPVTLKTYSFGLSLDYTNAIKAALSAETFGQMRQSLSGTGPFLVTTWLPLSDLPRDANGQFAKTLDASLLLVDLSGVEPSVALDFLHAQQTALRDNVRSDGPRQVRPFGPILADLLIKFDHTIPLIASAEAAVLKQFSPSNAKQDGATSAAK